jgi:glycosyltransferase involved in cell wall biosynthesis
MAKPSEDSAPERSALVLCPEAPYPAVGGGALRTASILDYLAPRYKVDVIVFREPEAPDPAPSFPAGGTRTVNVIGLPHHSKKPQARAARNLIRFLKGRPPLNDRFRGFAAEVSRCLARRPYELALIEHFWCAPYWEQIAPHAARTILDLHNIESVLYTRTAAPEPWPVSALFRRFASAASSLERQWIPRFSSVLVASEQDAEQVRRLAPGATVVVYPNSIPAVPRSSVRETEAIAFSGNLEYRPNISAVRFFRNEVWPILRERWPMLRWQVIGRNPGAVAGEVAGDPRIELIGPVEDAVATLAAARVVVAPLLTGSGTRVKILEAWAAGRAVVSTSIGAEGLGARDGEHLLVADTAESFADAVSRMLASVEQRQRIGAAGRALYEERFTWNRAWETLAGVGL